MRPPGTLVPRMRQAPDGGTEGGSQPTELSVSNRRVLLAPTLPSARAAQSWQNKAAKLGYTLAVASPLTRQPELFLSTRLFGLSQRKTPLNIQQGRCASGIMSSHGNHR